jgi:hypothetical protein
MADDDGDDDDGDSGSDDDDANKDKDKDRDKDDRDSGSDDRDEELDRLRRRMEAADKRASEAEKKVKEAEDAKKDDLTKAQEAKEEAEKKVTDLENEISGLRLRVAFLTANTQNWHDADVALKLAEAEGYLEDVRDEDGSVSKKALKKALERLAKEHKYLVADAKKDNDGEHDQPSGQSAGKRSKNNQDDKARKEELRKRFPVLNR